MRTFQDSFPRLHGVKPFMPLGPELAWPATLDWRDEEVVRIFARIVLARQEFAASRDAAWLDEISSAALTDLNDLLASSPDERTSRTILFLRFLFTIQPMESAFAHGRRGSAHDWAFCGLSSDHDPTRRYNSGFTYLPLRQADDPLIGALAMRWLPRWCYTFFMMARDAEVRKEVAAAFADCWDMLKGILEVDGRDNEQLRTEIFWAFASIASWAVHEDDPRSEQWVMQLLDAWAARIIPDSAAPVVATIFITRAYPLTGRSVRSWAEEVLARYGDKLREHERLQFLVASIDTRERWRELRPAIHAEIYALKALADSVAERGSNALFAREARLDVVKPLIRLLALDQDLGGALDVLTAWYRRDDSVRCDDNVMLVHPAINDGVAILWPGRAWINTATTSDGHERVVAALDAALGIETDPERGPLIDERREGMPNYALAQRVEEAMMSYYRPQTLAGQFRKVQAPRSLVVFPSVADPLQALLHRELGIMLPLEVSLAQTEPQRPIGSVSIWAGSTYYTDFEIEAIEAFAAIHGWSAEVFAASVDGDADDFRSFYQQEMPDVLWVAGHGEFVPHQPDETGIVVAAPRSGRTEGEEPGHAILPLHALSQFSVSGEGRRLLVLNTCNGATTQGMAGMARIGLAQSLVGPNQMVIGHLWPASSALGLAFGALFASNLDGRGPVEAFGATLLELRTPAAILPLLEERLGRPFQGGSKIASDANELAGILAWGCPVILT